jgi:hypothetical protein
MAPVLVAAKGKALAFHIIGKYNPFFQNFPPKVNNFSLINWIAVGYFLY